MSRFDQYFLMKEADVAEYVKEKLTIFSPDAQLSVREIGDGNLNYVFKVWEEATGRSVIVKHAGEALRISEDIHLSTDRNRIETEILQLEYQYAPGSVPQVYLYDPVMCAVSMEDLSDHEIMRTSMLKHRTFPLFADHITTFMVNTLVNTTDLIMDHQQKKELSKRFCNPELCDITEQYVYTVPYHRDDPLLRILPESRAFVEREVFGDPALILEAGKCKFEFMTNAQALIHGDLHTGSIFVKEDSTKVIDPEFAFYGPMGYDVGNVIANLIFAWNNGQQTIGDPAERERFCGWVEQTIVDVIDLFRQKFLALVKEKATDFFARRPGFAEWYLGTVMRDTAAVTGLELMRRTIGLAGVKDIQTIEPAERRAEAERVNVLAAKRFIKERERFAIGADFLDCMLASAAQAKAGC